MQKELLNIKNTSKQKKRWYLFQLITIWSFVIGLGAVIITELKRVDRIVMRMVKIIDKYKAYYLMYDGWLNLYQNQIFLDSFFSELNIKTVAVYGNGKICRSFMCAMENSKVKVCYYIDKNAERIIESIPVKSLNDELPKVDAIIVTIIDEFDNISKELNQKCDYPIISLEDVIYNCKAD